MYIPVGDRRYYTLSIYTAIQKGAFKSKKVYDLRRKSITVEEAAEAQRKYFHPTNIRQKAYAYFCWR